MSSRGLVIRAPFVRFHNPDSPGRREVLGTAGRWEELNLGHPKMTKLLVDYH